MRSSLSIIIPCKQEKDIVTMMVEVEKCHPEAQIIVSSDRYGRGKGWSLRQGLKEATGRIIVFIDGDMDIHPKEIHKLLPSLNNNDIVVGRKKASGSLIRKTITLCSRMFITLLFGICIDTQTGVKVFKRRCLHDWKDDSFAFDIEILYKAMKEGYRIKEVDVEVNIRKGMPFRSITRFIYGALRIRLCN